MIKTGIWSTHFSIEHFAAPSISMLLLLLMMLFSLIQWRVYCQLLLEIAINTHTHTINSNVFAVSIYRIQSHINGFNIEWRKGFTQRKIQLSKEKEKGIRIEWATLERTKKKLCHEIREEEKHTRRNGLLSKENTRIAGKMPILLKLWTLAALFLSCSLWLSITWNQRRHNKITFFEIG